MYCKKKGAPEEHPCLGYWATQRMTWPVKKMADVKKMSVGSPRHSDVKKMKPKMIWHVKKMRAWRVACKENELGRADSDVKKMSAWRVACKENGLAAP